MFIFALETSCDETSAAMVEDGSNVRSNVIASSRTAFERSGGVIPETAARRQVECILPVIDQCLEEAGVLPRQLDAIAVTKGPGLLGSLLVGTTTARVLAYVWRKPLIGVHHTLGHLSSTWLLPPNPNPIPNPSFPILTLSASGGHTDLWLRTSHLRGILLGRTRDDAAGEAFDKGASMLGLPYPGGPSISKAAETGKRDAFAFPHPLRKEDTLDFSFSGLKTALKYTMQKFSILHSPFSIADLAASYEHALCLHLVDRIERALALHPDIREVHVVGGVSANTHLRWMLGQRISIPVRTPASLSFCTDNAAMIAAAATFMVDELGDGAFEKFETGASLPLASCISL
jgi:N6-L-threonylcarbamoyladenine synthase